MTFRALAAGTCVLALLGCGDRKSPTTTEVAQRDPTPPRDAAAAAHDAAATPLTAAELAQTVPFECPTPPPATTCEPAAQWIVDLDAASGALLHGTHGSPWRDTCDRAAEAIKRGLAADPASLSNDERVLAQNLALKVIATSGCTDRPRPADELADANVAWSYRPPKWAGDRPGPNLWAPRAAAAQLIAHLALDTKTLVAIGAEPSAEVDAWIGDRASWQDRKSRSVPLQHDQIESFVRRFRPVRSGERRAVFSQLVAIDKAWQPHVVPIIGRIEIRLHQGDDAPGCAVKLSASRVRCDGSRLAVATVAGLQPNFFVRFASPTRLGCNECHGPSKFNPGTEIDGDLSPLPASQRTRHLKARQRAFLRGARELVGRAKRLAAATSD